MPDKPIGIDQAIKLGKRGAPSGNQNAVKNKDCNTTFVSHVKERGAAYIVARLDRGRMRKKPALRTGKVALTPGPGRPTVGAGAATGGTHHAQSVPLGRRDLQGCVRLR
jgi:hypothetical protein